VYDADQGVGHREGETWKGRTCRAIREVMRIVGNRAPNFAEKKRPAPTLTKWRASFEGWPSSRSRGRFARAHRRAGLFPVVVSCVEPL
jgi:hypothetical protein